MNRTLQTPDERLNALLTEIVGLTGEDYVVAMCQALQERRDRLVAAGPDSTAGDRARVIRLRLEADIPEDLLQSANR